MHVLHLPSMMFRNAVNRDLPEKQLHLNVIHLFHNVIHIILYFSVTALNQIHILIGFGRNWLKLAENKFTQIVFKSFLWEKHQLYYIASVSCHSSTSLSNFVNSLFAQV